MGVSFQSSAGTPLSNIYGCDTSLLLYYNDPRLTEQFMVLSSLTVFASEYETSIITIILQVCIQFCVEYGDVMTHLLRQYPAGIPAIRKILLNLQWWSLFWIGWADHNSPQYFTMAVAAIFIMCGIIQFDEQWNWNCSAIFFIIFTISSKYLL